MACTSFRSVSHGGMRHGTSPPLKDETNEKGPSKGRHGFGRCWRASASWLFGIHLCRVNTCPARDRRAVRHTKTNGHHFHSQGPRGGRACGGHLGRRRRLDGALTNRSGFFESLLGNPSTARHKSTTPQTRDLWPFFVERPQEQTLLIVLHQGRMPMPNLSAPNAFSPTGHRRAPLPEREGCAAVVQVMATL